MGAETEKGITFVIPVRHYENAPNWGQLKKLLAETIRSIAAQDSPHWNAVIAANRGSDLPPLPEKFEVAWVDFPPNAFHDKGTASKEVFYDSFRLDKGKRSLAAILHAKPREYLMQVDDDDFISRKLASHAESHSGEPGWFFQDGYVWPSGGKWLFHYGDFSNYCGTSHLIRTDLYEFPSRVEDAPEVYVKEILGAHRYLVGHMKSKGAPLVPLPFPGAIYRIQHPGAHSKSRGMVRTFFVNGTNLRNPFLLFDSFARLRSVNADIRREFTLEPV